MIVQHVVQLLRRWRPVADGPCVEPRETAAGDKAERERQQVIITAAAIARVSRDSVRNDRERLDRLELILQKEYESLARARRER